jgi:hypothetical protein
MKVDSFKASVTDFVDMYCTEYMNDISVEFEENFFDDEDMRAEITMIDPRRMKWTVPIAVNPLEDEIAIDIGDAGYLHADSGGLYCYLWHEASDRIAK